VGLNPRLQTQHNECFEGCNEINPNGAIRRLGADRNEAEFPIHSLTLGPNGPEAWEMWEAQQYI